MNSLNTHTYDGALKERKQQIIADLERVKDVEKTQAFEELRTLLALPPIQNALFSMIVSGPPQANHDPTNDLDAKNLLYLCWEKKGLDTDMIPLLRLAFEDMLTGSCPQGRSTRFFQVLVSIIS